MGKKPFRFLDGVNLLLLHCPFRFLAPSAGQDTGHCVVALMTSIFVKRTLGFVITQFRSPCLTVKIGVFHGKLVDNFGIRITTKPFSKFSFWRDRNRALLTFATG